MHATKSLVALALLLLAASASAAPEYDPEMFDVDIDEEPMEVDDLDDDYEDDEAEPADLDVDTEEDDEDDDDEAVNDDLDDTGDEVEDEQEAADEEDDDDSEEQRKIAKKGVAHLNKVRQIKSTLKARREENNEKIDSTEATLRKAKRALKKCKKAKDCPLARKHVIRLDKKLVVLKGKKDKYAKKIRKWVNVSKNYKEMLRGLLGKNFKWVHKRSFGPYRYHGHGLKVPHGLFSKHGPKKVHLAPKLKKPSFPSLEKNIGKMKHRMKHQNKKMAHLNKTGEKTVIPKSVKDALKADPKTFAPGYKKDEAEDWSKHSLAVPEPNRKKKLFVFRGPNLPKKKGEATKAKP